MRGWNLLASPTFDYRRKCKQASRSFDLSLLAQMVASQLPTETLAANCVSTTGKEFSPPPHYMHKNMQKRSLAGATR